MRGLLHSVQKGMLISNSICVPFWGAERGKRKDYGYEQFHSRATCVVLLMHMV